MDITNIIIKNLKSKSEYAILENNNIIFKEINSLFSFKNIPNNKNTIIITKENKYTNTLKLLSKSRIITYGDNAKFQILKINYLKNNIELEITKNKLPFIRLKLNLYSTYHAEAILKSFIYLFYLGYSKYELKSLIEKLNFNDYIIKNNIKYINYYNKYDFNEIINHIYTYDKSPIIIIDHKKNYNEINNLYLFSNYTYFILNKSLYNLVKKYKSFNYNISISIEDAIKNASTNTCKSIYVLKSKS